MSDRFEKNGRIDVSELWRALEDLEEDTLDSSRSEELTALLGKSPAARRAYLEYFQQSAVLRMEAAKLHERGLLPFVESASQARRVFQRSVMAAAALVTIAAVIAALIAVARPDPAKFSTAVTSGTRWSVDDVPQESGGNIGGVSEGSTLRVLSGTLRLETETGDLLVVQGPATVSFPKLHRPQLQSGWLWIDTAKSGKPFEVGAKGLLVRDIGTRFGVRVPTGGPTEVHLVDGQIEVIAARSGKKVSTLREAGKAFAYRSKDVVEEIAMAPDPFPTLPDLLKQPANYRTTVFGQAPIGYWTLDQPVKGSYSNMVAGSPSASQSQAVRPLEPGVKPEDGFPGLPAGNRSVYMEGDPNRSVIIGLEGMHGISQREGAVSFWIRREPGAITKGEVLWLAGQGNETSDTPFEAILHTRMDPSGQVIFEMRNGDTSVNLVSPRQINDGIWHYVVASWEPSSVDLFIDGVLVGHDAQPRTIREGNFRGRYVRFGKPSLDQRETFNPFTGWVDEISLWDRPLSAVEVSCQFEAAVGSGKE
ncbi:FecR domain-containing protein [Akkermansiaceae bacterium]|nr:FecR domain-containing protein [Akkermansiaceae bacterium]